MSRSVTLNYERYRAPSGSHLTEQPKGHNMPRYSDALNLIFTGMPRNVPAAPAGVDVEIIVHRSGTTLPVVRFTNVPLSVVEEAIAHVNDNADGAGA